MDILGGHLELDEASGRKWKQGPQGQAPFLLTPLAIQPQGTLAGTLVFWLDPTLGQLVGDQLADALEHPGMARIQIEDYVSGRHITVPVPGAYP